MFCSDICDFTSYTRLTKTKDLNISYATHCNMNEIVLKKFCEKHGFSVSLLKKIIICRVHGYNNSDCAKKIGVNRVTVQRYIEAFKQADSKEIRDIMLNIFHAKNQTIMIKEVQ